MFTGRIHLISVQVCAGIQTDMANFNFYNLMDDENEEESEVQMIPGRDSVIIAIDCCQEMFQSPIDSDEEATPFTRTCEAIKDLLRNRIICNDRELHGVVLFNTEKESNRSGFKHIYVVQDLDVPSAARIEELQNLEDATDDFMKDAYGINDPCLIGELLWCCTSMFSHCTVKLSSKTIIFFTWDDNPHRDNPDLQRIAKTKANDLIEQGTVIQILSFNPNFDYSTFYRSIMSDVEVDARLVENPVDGIKDLYDLLLRKCSKQRSVANVGFKIADGVEMAVGIYTPARRAVKTKSIRIDPKTNKEVVFKRNFVDKETAEILMMSDVKYAQTWGDKSICFEYEEVQEMKRFSGAGLRLLGFKPFDKAIKIHQHVRQSQFLYPNDKSVVGSAKLFAALLTKCIEKKVVPICSFSARNNIPPRLVALLPQHEEVDDDTGEQIRPPGFYVVYIPFAEDIRNVEVPESLEPNEEDVDAAKKIIKKLKFRYQPSNFENPSLQTHYRNLEAMALEKDEPEMVQDFTLPDRNRIHQKAGDLIEQFKGLVYPEGYDPTSKPKPAATKRKASGSSGGPESKQMSMAEVKDMVEHGKLAKLTVRTLKDICKSRGLTVAGRKNDLLQAITSSFAD